MIAAHKPSFSSSSTQTLDCRHSIDYVEGIRNANSRESSSFYPKFCRSLIAFAGFHIETRNPPSTRKIGCDQAFVDRKRPDATIGNRSFRKVHDINFSTRSNLASNWISPNPYSRETRGELLIDTRGERKDGIRAAERNRYPNGGRKWKMGAERKKKMIREDSIRVRLWGELWRFEFHLVGLLW